MGSSIYVTEPDVIDLRLVRQTLKGKGVIAVAGTPNFSRSNDQDYDTLLIRSATHIDENIKKHFPHLKYIVRAGVGLDNVDLAYCNSHGISIFNAPGANADAVSEYVVAMILYALRKIYILDEERVRDWDRFAFRGSSIREHTVGIVGFGHVGKLLYEKLQAFSVPNFLVFDPYVSPESIHTDNIQLTTLDDLLKRSTIISLHLPLTEDTYHLINKRNLSLVQNGSLVINAARGGIVDEMAIVHRAATGELMYVADTVEGEPKVDERLLGSANIIVTPHIASLTNHSEEEMVRLALNNFLSGVPAKVFG